MAEKVAAITTRAGMGKSPDGGTTVSVGLRGEKSMGGWESRAADLRVVLSSKQFSRKDKTRQVGPLQTRPANWRASAFRYTAVGTPDTGAYMKWWRMQFSLLALVIALVAGRGWCQKQTATTPANGDKPFAPFEQWKDLVIKRDSYGLKALYSMNPVAQIKVGADDLDASGDVRFWTGLKATSMKVDLLPGGAPQVLPGTYQVLFRAEIQSAAGEKEQTLYVTEGQLWQQQDQEWRLVVVKRTAVSRLEQPASNQKNIYPASADAHEEIKEALSKGGKEHKRVLVVFGANWCYDCHVLDLAFQRADIAPILGGNFEIVHVDVGQGEKNQDLMKEYNVPMERGIPAIAVLDSDGTLLYSQKNGEFEKARALGPDDLVKFLNQWKPVAQKG
jgi:thioredoxin 1